MALEPEYCTVRDEMIAAGIDVATLNSPGSIHQAMQQLYHSDPDRNEPVVERWRSMLEPGDTRAQEAELAEQFAAERGIKGCPACHLEPTVTPKGHIVCEQHPEEMKIGTYGRSYTDSVVSWNEDGSWIMLGADQEKVENRPLYPFRTNASA
ncbi:TPA: hypothetical protein L4559_005201 [Pseudomonas aeruginosa]|nr:hypothetical protein [Pseudomonas aeruginosa]